MSYCLGSKTFKEEAYSAPIIDEMLLGMDFMQKYGIIIDIPASVIEIHRERIPMNFGSEHDYRRYPVRLYGTTLVPPGSAARVRCMIGSELESGLFMLEPNPNLTVLVPRTLHSEKSCF